MTWIETLRTLLGTDSVLTDDDTIRQQSYDWWPVALKWRQQGRQPYKPEAVVRPGSVEQVSRLLRWASQNHIAVTPRGAGSSVTGAALPLRGGIMLDMSLMNRVEMMDDINLLVRVQAGKMGHELERELNERGYTLNHSPQSLDRSTVGGWVATRATGQFSSRWGGIEDLVVSLTAVLPTGEVVETKTTPRAAIGPDLRHVFMGAEGTMGVITTVTLKLFPRAPYQRLEAVTFPDVQSGVTAMRRIMRVGLRPFLVRFYDEDEAHHAMQDNRFQTCVLFLGFEGLKSVAEAEYSASMDICAAEGGKAIGAASVDAWMRRRFDFSTVENLLNMPGGVAETIEIVHFWDSILETYVELKQALRPLAEEVLGHFSHVYPQGTSLYMILLGQVEDDARAEQRIQEFWDVSMRICLDKGAAISHHHGIGIVRLPYLQDDLASSAIVLGKVKAALDPAQIMNPGKLGLA